MDQMTRLSSTLDLVQKAQRGDREAFEGLIQRYDARLRALIQLRLGTKLRQRVEVDDVLQETFMRAFTSIGDFEWRNNGAFFHWLGGIAENVLQGLVRYHFKTQKRTPPREVSLSASDSGEQPGLVKDLMHPSVTPAKAIRRRERFERLESALDQLSKDHREVIILARVRELPIKEIAKRMGRSPDAVSMLLLRALQSLRKHFGSTASLRLPRCSLDSGGEDFSGRDGAQEPDDEPRGSGPDPGTNGKP